MPPKELDYYERQGVWLVQPKYNGSRAVIHVTTDGTVTIWDRHGGAHRSYMMSASVRDQILALPGLTKGLEYWLDSELMIKTSAPETKNKLILFDVLQADKYLFLKPNQVGRLAILDEICGKPRTLDPWRGMGYQISSDLLMAPSFYDNFKFHFNEDKGDEVEGLVLRRKDSVLDDFGQKEYKCNWIIRCRKPHANYNF